MRPILESAAILVRIDRQRELRVGGAAGGSAEEAAERRLGVLPVILEWCMRFLTCWYKATLLLVVHALLVGDTGIHYGQSGYGAGATAWVRARWRRPGLEAEALPRPRDYSHCTMRRGTPRTCTRICIRMRGGLVHA